MMRTDTGSVPLGHKNSSMQGIETNKSKFGTLFSSNKSQASKNKFRSQLITRNNSPLASSNNVGFNFDIKEVDNTSNSNTESKTTPLTVSKKPSKPSTGKKAAKGSRLHTQTKSRQSKHSKCKSMTTKDFYKVRKINQEPAKKIDFVIREAPKHKVKSRYLRGEHFSEIKFSKLTQTMETNIIELANKMDQLISAIPEGSFRKVDLLNNSLKARRYSRTNFDFKDPNHNIHNELLKMHNGKKD